MIPSKTLAITLLLVIGTQLTRWLPFILFPEHRKVPDFIVFLGQFLPPALMGLLVVYALKNISLTKPPYGIPEIVASSLTLWIYYKKNSLALSILFGTLTYMFLVQGINL